MNKNLIDIASEIESLSKINEMTPYQITKELTKYFYLQQYSDAVDEYMYSNKEIKEIVKELGISTKKLYIILKKRKLPKRQEILKKKRKYYFYIKKEQKRLEDKKLPELISKITELSKSIGITEEQITDELKKYFYLKMFEKPIQDYRKGTKRVVDIIKELNVSPRIFYKILEKNKIAKKYKLVKKKEKLSNLDEN